jgi:hypothetical protein
MIFLPFLVPLLLHVLQGFRRSIEGAAHGIVATMRDLFMSELLFFFFAFHVASVPVAKKPLKPTDRPSSPRFKKKGKGAIQQEDVTLRTLIRQRPTEAEWKASWSEIREQGPRSSGVVSAAFTEDALRHAVLTRLIPQLEPREIDRPLEPPGPLSSFYQMIEIGYALGLYGNILREDLHTIRTIRNGFAHALKPITFDTSQITKEIAKLRYLPTIYAVKGAETPGAPWVKPMSRGFAQSNSNREKYELTCQAAADELLFSNPPHSLARFLRMQPKLP